MFKLEDGSDLMGHTKDFYRGTEGAAAKPAKPAEKPVLYNKESKALLAKINKIRPKAEKGVSTCPASKNHPPSYKRGYALSNSYLQASMGVLFYPQRMPCGCFSAETLFYDDVEELIVFLQKEYDAFLI